MQRSALKKVRNGRETQARVNIYVYFLYRACAWILFSTILVLVGVSKCQTLTLGGFGNPVGLFKVAGLSISGLSFVGLSVVGLSGVVLSGVVLSVVGLSVVGLSVVELWVVGLWVVGLSVIGFFSR